MSLGGWEGEGWGWGRLGSHQSLSTVCVDTEAWAFRGEDWSGEGLSFFDSAVAMFNRGAPPHPEGSEQECTPPS